MGGALALEQRSARHLGSLECVVSRVDAGVLAAAGARRLVCTHIYDQFDRPGVRERVVAEMSRVYDGVIVIGEDLMQLSLEPENPGIFS